MLCVHHNDTDGRCAAAIVKLFHAGKKKLTFIEMDYNREFPLDQVRKDEEVVIVDFSLKPEVMEKLLKITTDVIWIDHHKTVMDYKYSIELPGLRSLKASACKLTWQYFTNDPIPEAVELISDYDNWDWLHGEWTEAFYVGMDVRSLSPTDAQWEAFLLHDAIVYKAHVESTVAIGKACIKMRDQLADHFTSNYGFVADFDGIKVFVVNFYKFGSKLFERGEFLHVYDYCLTFIWDGEQYTVGVYTIKEGLHAGDLAAKYGGGGHKGAAGFRCKELPFKKIA